MRALRSLVLPATLLLLPGCGRAELPPSPPPAEGAAPDNRELERASAERLLAEASHSVYRVGGDVRPPVVIERVEPFSSGPRLDICISMYVAELEIDEAGAVTAVRVLKISAQTHGDPVTNKELLDEARARIEAGLRRWRWKPATRSGVPVPVVFNVSSQLRCSR